MRSAPRHLVFFHMVRLTINCGVTVRSANSALDQGRTLVIWGKFVGFVPLTIASSPQKCKAYAVKTGVIAESEVTPILREAYRKYQRVVFSFFVPMAPPMLG
jgi:hypothetical protein